MERYNITYLLGAGASCNCLPTYSDFHSRLEQFFSIISENRMDISIIKNYHKLLLNIPLHITPDAYVKTLHLTGDPNETSLKRLICAYLVFEQLIKNQNSLIDWPRRLESFFLDSVVNKLDRNARYLRIEQFTKFIDPRYLPFFANLLNKNESRINIAPIKILSWNYDSQIETTLEKFSIKLENNKYSDFEFIKLNGTSNFKLTDEMDFFNFNSDAFSHGVMGKFADFLSQQNNPCSSMKLKFAWETDDEEVQEARSKAVSILKETDIVVVIGYSFPDFNRSIDREIFSKFEGKKIYIQDPKGEIIRERFNGVKPDFKNIHIRFDPDNFLVPSEFWESKKGNWLELIGN